MFMRVVTLVTLVTLKIAPAGGKGMATNHQPPTLNQLLVRFGTAWDGNWDGSKPTKPL